MQLEERPILVSITGIDGSGKSTAETMATGILTKEFDLLKPSRPVYTITDGIKTNHYPMTTILIDRLHNMADQLHNRTLVSFANALSLTLSTRLFEPVLVKKYKPDIVMHGRDYYVDPAVYSVFYSPGLGSCSMPERINKLRMMFNAPFRDLVFFLDLSPEEAVARINIRIANEKKSPSSVEREKWLHMHENVPVLTKLRSEYRTALRTLEEKSPRTSIFEIDVVGKSREDIAQFVAQTIRNRLINNES